MPAKDQRALGWQARQHILDHYSLEKMAAGYAGLYQDIIIHGRYRK